MKRGVSTVVAAMRAFKDIPIKQKLTLVIVLTSGVAIAVASALIVGYQIVTARLAAVHDLATVAEIIAVNSAAPLEFQDDKAAEKTLATLKARPEILVGRIYDKRGKLFAQYARPGVDPAASAPDLFGEQHQFEGSQLVLSHCIYAGGTLIGTVMLRSDRAEAQWQLRYSVMIVAILMAAAVCMALLMAGRLQEIVSGPIRNLSQVARTIATEKNYSLRAVQQSQDETGVLVGAFNQMLDQIQQRDEALGASEERFRQLAESINEVFWMTDAEKMQMIYVSPGYGEMWGRSCESLYLSPMTWMDAIHPEDRDRVRQAALTRQVNGTYDEEYRIVRPDDSIRWIRDRAFPIRDKDGKVYRIAGIAEDITERKRLSKEILEVSDREQRRIGQDLHDGLCQHLTGTAFAAKVLDERLQTASPELAKAATEIAELVNQAITQARTIARGLYPVELEAFGLSSALEELALEVRRRYHIACRVVSPQRVAITDHAAALHLYRIAQEALNNAVRHGKPRHINIGFEEHNGQVSLRIEDDGVGIADPATNGGMGLHIMAYRARMIGATLAVRRGARAGTVVSCSLDKPVDGPGEATA